MDYHLYVCVCQRDRARETYKETHTKSQADRGACIVFQVDKVLHGLNFNKQEFNLLEFAKQSNEGIT